MTQERLHLGRAHVLRMAFVVKKYEPARPVDVSLFRADAVMARAQMITQMVESLAARLRTNGNDLPGWLRLVRAYAVLERRQDAQAALAEARRNFTGNVDALAQLAALASSLGLGS